MLKKIFYLLFITLSFNKGFSQILYSERFNNLSLNTGTYTANSSTQTYLYSDVSNGMYAINNGSLTADTLTGNYPFRANGQKQKAWLGYSPANSTDTFAVSTSWLKPISTASAWLITDTIKNITATTVLTWEAMAPDINNPDGYEVYVTTTTSTTPVTGNFTTLLFSTTAEKNIWQTHGISLAAFANQKIRIAFKNNSIDKYQLWLDDIIVQNINNEFDATAVSHDIYKYSVINTNNTISTTFKNNGYAPITNLTINYQMGNSSTVSENKILSPPLNYLESRQLTFTTPYFSTTPTYNTFAIWATFVNSSADQVIDSIKGSITISSSSPAKKVLVEEYTEARCGWCPDGQTVLSSIANTNTNVIAAAIHDNDNMSTIEGNSLIADFTPTLPSATIDHHYFSANEKIAIERTNWNTFITQRLAMKVPATVAVTNPTYNPTTHQIDATVSATFVGDVKGDYRLNLYIKENNVYGPLNDLTDNQWNQYNYLYNIGSSPYYQLGSYLNASTYLLSPADYKHKYVINSMVDGAYGASGIIHANSLTKDSTFSKIYSYILPTALAGEFRYNVDNIYLIGVLSEYDSNIKKRSILNSFEVKLNNNAETLVGVKENEKTAVQLNIFPNPTTDVCNLTYTLKENEFVKVSVYNTLGELVYIETKNVNAGNVVHELNLRDLPSGNYSVQVSFKNNSITKKLTIIK